MIKGRARDHDHQYHGFFRDTCGICDEREERTPTDDLENLTRNILVGTAGASVGLQITGGVYGSSETGVYAVTLVIAAITGAMLLLFIVNRARRA